MRGIQNKTGIAYKRDVVAATNVSTATAGDPGSWSGHVPYDCEQLALGGSSYVASPATAWTVGQYVALAGGDQAYWTGTAWVCGADEAAPSASPVSTLPCDNKPAASAGKPVLLAWLEGVGIDIEDPSSLTKDELRTLIDDFCDE